MQMLVLTNLNCVLVQLLLLAGSFLFQIAYADMVVLLCCNSLNEFGLIRYMVSGCVSKLQAKMCTRCACRCCAGRHPLESSFGTRKNGTKTAQHVLIFRYLALLSSSEQKASPGDGEEE